MGLFDKLFGKKKNKENISDVLPEEKVAESESNVIIESENKNENTGKTADFDNKKTELPPTGEQLTVEEYVAKFRKAYRKYFPKSLDSIESHMQLPYMIGATFDVSSVIEEAKNGVYSKFNGDSEKLSEKSRAAVAQVALMIDKNLELSDDETLKAACARSHTESLEKTWIVLDFYCEMLKADYIKHIKKAYGLVTEQLIARGVAPEISVESDYEATLLQCSKLIAENANSEEISTFKKKIFSLLLKQERIYVPHDETFNKSFPYVGADGKTEVLTNEKRAQELKNFLEKNNECRVTLNEYKNTDILKFFEDILHMGLGKIRLENGFAPIELNVEDYDVGKQTNLLEICNRSVRGYFIKELQYGYRLEKLLSDEKESDVYKIISNAMVNARNNGYRALAGGLIYALCVGNGNSANEKTLYTPNALIKAKEIMKVMGVIDENVLVAPGNNGYEIYEGKLALKTVQKRGAAPEEGLVCAFTDKKGADAICERIKEAGTECFVTVITLAELCAGASACAGFVLDMNTYGIEISKDLFQKMGECARTSGQIVAGKEISEN